MRHVTEITLHNWGPFKGTHTLALEPTVYAVTAEHTDDVERSNWIGKTWFLNSMLFALTGIKPESCKTEDGWITNGEAEGFVEMVCDDATRVKRSRKRERSTQLVVTMPGGKPQKQGPAQESLYRAMGLDGTDLLASCFIRQKQIARLITADPSERTDIVNAWVELEPLQVAEQWLRDRLNALLTEDRTLDAKLGDEPADDLVETRDFLARAQTSLAELEAERTALLQQVDGLTEWRQHERNVDEFTEVREQGRSLRAQVDAYQAPDLDALSLTADATRTAQGGASDREAQLSELLQGEWNGECPLTCIECPVRPEVEAHGASMEIEHGESEIVLDEAAAAADVAKEAHQDAQVAASAQVTRERDLVRLRARATELAPSVGVMDDKGPSPDLDDLGERVAQLNGDVTTYQRSVAELEGKVAAHARYAKALQAVAQRRAVLDGSIRTHREAIAVVGRQGAQREVAESALGRIEHGANTLLRTAGIDLGVQVRWAREGRGLATHCSSCGTAFPKSLKVKACEICGDARGPKLVEKLDIQPTERSGAADDIAGLSFQLAASSWLRSRRSASWSSTCIDEPFGALDAANSRALSTHLHALIRGSYAFDQGFLVAHDAATMEALPARIKIYGSGEGAAVEVQT